MQAYAIKLAGNDQRYRQLSELVRREYAYDD